MLAYQHSAGVLSGSKASGVIRVDADATNPNPSKALKQISEHYRSSVVSLLNAIIATGIVLHHTALIPGERRVPRKESDIAEYHRERGFEILCSGRVYQRTHQKLRFQYI